MEEVVKKPRLDVSLTDGFDKNNPFTEGKAEDEVELKFNEGKSLFVSKAFLISSSPVFTKMFQSDFKEADSNTVEMKEKNYKVFLDMLLCLHPRVQKEIPDETAKYIYQIAHEYQIPSVLNKAETNMQSQITSQRVSSWRQHYSFRGRRGKIVHKDETRWNGYDFLNKIFEFLLIAQFYNNASLVSSAAERISVVSMGDFTSHSSYKDLAESTKIKILMYRLKRLDKDKEGVVGVQNETLDLDF